MRESARPDVVADVLFISWDTAHFFTISYCFLIWNAKIDYKYDLVKLTFLLIFWGYTAGYVMNCMILPHYLILRPLDTHNVSLLIDYFYYSFFFTAL